MLWVYAVPFGARRPIAKIEYGEYPVLTPPSAYADTQHTANVNKDKMYLLNLFILLCYKRKAHKYKITNYKDGIFSPFCKIIRISTCKNGHILGIF